MQAVGSPRSLGSPSLPPSARTAGSVGSSAVGSLCDNLPAYCFDPPIETVVFAWGVNEDGQVCEPDLTC